MVDGEPGKPVQVGILGFGNVGSGTFATLQENAANIARRAGGPVVVRRIADVDWRRPRPLGVDVPADVRTRDPYAVINDPEIAIVVECIGGVTPARELVLAALRAGQNVVTSNKELIAKHGHELLDEADARGLDIAFEGSVGGGIPVLRPLKESLAGDSIHTVIGIVNGTTNYILTQMTARGRDYAEVLAEAQQHGYAEADPTSDIEGYDATYKLAILASIAFSSRVRLEEIYREGIGRVTAADIGYAGQLGYVVKLLAIARDTPEGLELRVHPAFLPATHPLAAVSDVFNAIFVEGSSVGEVMFYGRGAGARPTGSAMAGDIVEVARNIRHGCTGRVPCTCFYDKPVRPMEDIETKHYFRTRVADRPGVLARMAAVFGEEQVSIASLLQTSAAAEEAEIVWITHRTREGGMRRALDRIARLPEVMEVCSWIRVEA